MENDSNSDNDSKDFESKVCMICKDSQKIVEYQCMPCRCKILCKKCAMKVASGGKCKNCKNFFVECKRN